MAVSGRAGLFTMDAGPFFDDLRGMPYTASKRQKSGAIRMEFGQVRIPSAVTTAASVKTTIMVGIMSVVTPGKLPIEGTSTSGSPVSGVFALATSSFVSGHVPIALKMTGQFSGQHSGMEVNYLVLGYT